jgi:hypothetical protein
MSGLINPPSGTISASGTPADNQVAVWTSATAVEGTSGLTFDGTTLTIPGQVKFPATQSASSDANTLDDYEEGTWTPVIGGAGGTSGQSYIQQTGFYVKFGQIVIAGFYVFLGTEGTITGNAQIQGLPFTSLTTAGAPVAVSPLMWDGLQTNFVSVVAYVNSAATVAPIVGAAAAAATNNTALTAANIQANTILCGTFCYRASA